ncbi:MAG: T9SS type A sorting domain-containing protein [Calditrichia bacterium]|nr:T9SS type A sorting domain-containing protein [Calditrichia bacterium]
MIELNIDLNPGDMSDTVQFDLSAQSEVILHLEMNSNTNWAVSGMESAVLTLFIDENYEDRNQDIVLFNGEQPFIYQVSIGRFDLGTHTLQFYFDGEKSSPNADHIHIEKWDIITIKSDDENYDIVRFSPILYGRDDNYYTDTPLLMWHEIEIADKYRWLKYSIIWTNEDGGTSSSNLMSRWGRTTDIEWIYWVRIDSTGNILEDYYQGSGHTTSTFHGEKVDDHPILKTVTLNNMVSDEGISDYKFFLSPQRSKGEDYSREILMDNNPWTYKIMTEEMINEGKYESPADPFTVDVSDTRNYLYLEFNSQMQGIDLRLTFGVKLKDDLSWYYSDHNDPAVQSVNKTGWRRTTIELPEGTFNDNLDSLKIIGYSDDDFSIIITDLSKIFMISNDFTLMKFPLVWKENVVLDEINSMALFAFDGLTAIAESQFAMTPDNFSLVQNYPNPFNASTSFRYQLSNPCKVVLKIYNIEGQEIKTLINKYHYSPGLYTIRWDGRNNAARVVSSGLYFYRITAGKFTQTRKMTIIK